MSLRLRNKKKKEKKKVRYNSRFTQSDFLLGANLKPVYESDLCCVRIPQLQLCQRDCHSQTHVYTVERQQDKLRWQSKEHNTCICHATTTIQGILSIHLLIAIKKNTWMREVETLNTDYEFDDGERLGIIFKSY